MSDTTPPPSDPDRLPDSADPNGPCPRCGRVAHFAPVGTADVTFRKDGSLVADARWSLLPRRRRA